VFIPRATINLLRLNGPMRMKGFFSSRTHVIINIQKMKL